LVRDPVHFTVPMTSEERTVIDHPLFQRLRRIKQTAFLNLVFPGATHDRFSHSIGVMHVVGILFDRVAEEFVSTYGQKSFVPESRDYMRRLLRFAALLHDVGHGPFSHSLEGVSRAGRPIHPLREDYLEKGPIPDHWIDPKWRKSTKWLKEPVHHEDFTVGILAMMADDAGMIGGIEAQAIAALINDWVVPTEELKARMKLGPTARWGGREAFRGFVSGELDADRMDYLLRDSHYTGVPYGQYDREMLLGNIVLRPHPDANGQLTLALRRKAVHAFEDFLISRFHMFMQLYSHKTTIGFDIILENALAELPDFSINPDLEEYTRWSDDWLLRKILENRSSRWGTHIRDRIALKHLFTVSQADQNIFQKWVKPYEISEGTTAWFPSLRARTPTKKALHDVPKIWWRHTTSYLTKGVRGHFPVFLEDRRRLIPMENVSLLLKSDYVRKFEMTHVYCLREDESKVLGWMLKSKIPDTFISPPRNLIED
jgi:HD superfamily phosphohydrolase